MKKFLLALLIALNFSVLSLHLLADGPTGGTIDLCVRTQCETHGTGCIQHPPPPL